MWSARDAGGALWRGFLSGGRRRLPAVGIAVSGVCGFRGVASAVGDGDGMTAVGDGDGMTAVGDGDGMTAVG
jgi:hypothetical protein